MTGLDYILAGLEAELALERELGVRTLEIDRSLLAAPQPSSPSSPQTDDGRRPAAAAPRPSAPAPQSPAPRPPIPASPQTANPALSLVFLHDRPLSPAGEEMMAKIIEALKLPDGAVRVVVAPPLPQAKVYIVLGAWALRKWFPGEPGSPGQWIRTKEGMDVLVSNSPEYILRFKTVTPTLKKIKVEMWQAIKSALRRI